MDFPELDTLFERGSDYLFDDALAAYTDAEGLSEDEKRYVRETVELIVAFEKLYRIYYFRESYTADDFRRDSSPLGENAAQLAAVGQLRQYGERDVEALTYATATLSFFEQQLLGSGSFLDRFEPARTDGVDSPTLTDFHSEIDAPRLLIETLVQA